LTALRHISTEGYYRQETLLNNINTTVYEETLTGRPHDTSVQKATSDNENVDAV